MTKKIKWAICTGVTSVALSVLVACGGSGSEPTAVAGSAASPTMLRSSESGSSTGATTLTTAAAKAAAGNFTLLAWNDLGN